MLGREAYQYPWLLSQVDHQLFGDQASSMSRSELADALLPYLQETLSKGGRINHVLRHVLGLYQRQPGGKVFRRLLSEGMHQEGADTELFRSAVAHTEQIIERRSA
jgi:tRNA-dihydrouridine synthase A